MLSVRRLIMSEQPLVTATDVQRCRLSDLLRPPEAGGPDVFLADRHAAEAAVAEGSDPVLYRAWRDVLPTRGTLLGGDPAWSADLVVYQDGTLPGGEPFRSTGHWNPGGQVEVFQVLTGRVLIVTATASAAERLSVEYQECAPGDMAVVPFGAWHLTYVLDGPAMVFNVYTSQASSNGAARAGAGSSKYRSARGPAPVAVIRRGSSLAFIRGSADLGAPVAVTCPQWARGFLPSGASLADWLVGAPAAKLRDFAGAAQAAALPGWPAIGEARQPR
jgi:hypothetical protein